MRNLLIIIPLLLLISACSKAPEDSKEQEEKVVEAADPKSELDQPYEGFQQDRADLRDTYLIEKQNIRASSGKAGTAAQRVFTKIDFVEMPKREVMRLLGDPQTISDYGRVIADGADAPLVYLFDSGYGGNQWTIQFQDGVATKVEHAGLD